MGVPSLEGVKSKTKTDNLSPLSDPRNRRENGANQTVDFLHSPGTRWAGGKIARPQSLPQLVSELQVSEPQHSLYPPSGALCKTQGLLYRCMCWGERWQFLLNPKGGADSTEGHMQFASSESQTNSPGYTLSSLTMPMDSDLCEA